MEDRHVLRRRSGRERRVTQAVTPMTGISVLTRLGSLWATIQPASRNAPARIRAAGEGTDRVPCRREFKTSALMTASARSSGAASTNQPDRAASAAMSVETTMAVAMSRLGVSSSQYFLVMLRSPRLQRLGRSLALLVFYAGETAEFPPQVQAASPAEPP